MEAPGRRAALGVAFLIIAVACFAVLNTTVKVVGASVSVLVAVWFRYVFQALAVTAVMLPLRGLLLFTVSVLSFVSGGFVGTLLVVQPGSATIGWASLLPLAMVLTYAGIQILTSRMARTEDPMTMHFFTGWVGALQATAMLPWVWRAMPDWPMLPHSCPSSTPKLALPCCAVGRCLTMCRADWNRWASC